MSLILEALKKSEAERQRGQAPGLFVEQAPLARTRREGAPAWAYALGALLVAVLAFLGWREWNRESPAAPASRVSEAPPPAIQEPVRQAPAPVAIEVPAPAPAPAVQAVPARVEAAPVAAVAPAVEAPIEATPAIAAAPASEPAPASPPRLADLAAGERAALPPLKLTMHVFADDPAARFVILDGRRLGEGAMVADGVVLRDIDRDGVVIEAQGRALRLPRP